MGNICSGGKEESKASAFVASDNYASDIHNVTDIGDASIINSSTIGDSSHNMFDSNGHPSQQQQQQQQHLQQHNQESSPSDAASRAANEAQLLERREEQNRLEVVVQMAGRGMVSVRSTRGSTGYYDQGFAAALGQHLEQTTTFADQLPIRLPPQQPKQSSKSLSSSTSTVVQRLSQPQWENIAMGNKGTGLAGCGGENPNTYMDHVAVSLLDSVVPKKERIFHGGVGPMVENLL